MDKMTIVDNQGKAKYLLDEENSIIDLRKHCSCQGEGRPEQRDGNQRICLICNLEIAQGE